ncbi:acetyl-CoA carboxylase biotin carboxyl carrier protein [Mesohalobacter halotolerans]|uniref:Biotin carboxyl carrier protein of acetyl-CoA carboxylase n=1 Tax=Mesohalobacter halotolerans TaxID=1883405 RepID=A0A4U5TQZ0_9FLAO|nr:acetyl-CoA carboxylase biotin carboxyl carrier protein [Mesohalobacter halotolerans]TKS56171.1 acetyl-CoA carboxylase biotin carboxyl carrier protein [Mesohalobacter halotolerans]
MNLKQIQNLIKFVAKSGASEVKLEMDDVKVTIRTGSNDDNKETIVQQIPVSAVQQQAPAPQPAQEQTPQQEKKASHDQKDEENLVTVKSPIIGTFYRKPSPDKPVFVEVGDSIKEGDVLCTIEAMKLFNEIESEVSGKIVKVLVDDATPVEFDQPLFLVEPS